VPAQPLREEAPSSSPRSAQALFFRSILGFLAERGLTASVRSRVSVPTQWVMDRPPWFGCWIPSLPVDEIEAVLQQLGGAQLNMDLGRHVARQMAHRLLQPVLHAIFALLGRTPESVFRNLNLCFSLVTRGISFVYVPGGEGGRQVVARFRGLDTPRAAWHALRGALGYAFDVAGTQGSIGEPVLLAENEAGATVRYPVEWT